MLPTCSRSRTILNINSQHSATQTTHATPRQLLKRVTLDVCGRTFQTAYNTLCVFLSFKWHLSPVKHMIFVCICRSPKFEIISTTINRMLRSIGMNLRHSSLRHHGFTTMDLSSALYLIIFISAFFNVYFALCFWFHALHFVRAHCRSIHIFFIYS